MICAQIYDVNVRNKFCLHQNNTCSEVVACEKVCIKIQGTKTAGNMFLKPAVNVAAPFLGMMSDPVESENLQVAQARTKILKSITGGRILSLTGVHSGNGLRLREI